ncbi:hypothetical protein AX17_005369 [Amanita inopinata Kibby_2008]|nr:hypothetical protein AX17_005369 [Amanita inopinata Kibby_2008]
MASPYHADEMPRNPFVDGHGRNNYLYAAPSNAEYQLASMASPIRTPNKTTDDTRLRTPSPTPSEAQALKSGTLDWKTLSNWRFWIRKQWRWYYVALIIILVITALVTLYHKQIVHWLTPMTRWLHDLRFGWLVPIGILFVISFPPLFGHEIVAILCGLVWGLWVGFGIVAAGTFLGEVGNFYAFKFCCRARGEKLERTKISYACLAKVVRDGGFKIALIARLSAIPGHFTTAVFSACGMGIIVFSIAAILSLPKQFITVYLGVILEQSDTGTTNTKSRIISDVVLGVTFLITIIAMWYILHQMNRVKPDIIYKRRRARLAKLVRQSSMPLTSSASISSTDSDTLPLTTSNTSYQQWDRRGALNSTSEVSLYAPVPQRPKGHSLDLEDYSVSHETIRRRDEEEIEWDMSARDAYAGIADPTDVPGGTQFNVSTQPQPYDTSRFPSATSLSSTSTVVTGPSPQSSETRKAGMNLPRLQTPQAHDRRYPGGVSKVIQTPTQGSYFVSLGSHAQGDEDHTALPPPLPTPPFPPDAHNASGPSQGSSDLPYRSAVTPEPIRSTVDAAARGHPGTTVGQQSSSPPPPPSYPGYAY